MVASKGEGEKRSPQKVDRIIERVPRGTFPNGVHMRVGTLRVRKEIWKTWRSGWDCEVLLLC